MTEENFSNFVLAHDDDDPARLLLSAGRWPDIDVRRAARAIEARRKVRDKIPSWLAHPAIDYPSSLSLEQCSSEETARYKQAFVPAGGTDAAGAPCAAATAGAAAVADLTGGLGVDTWMLAQRAATVDYYERNPELCAAARHNFAELGLANVTVHEGDGVAWLRCHPGRFALIYLDPARRGGGSRSGSRSGSNGRRLYDIADCEPNLLEILPLLLEKADRVLAKISPMADITRTLSQIPEIRELHVVAAAGEVKEILLLMEPLPESGQQAAPKIVAVDGSIRFEFTPDEEPAAEVRYADNVGRYLFQPSKALRKAGAFRLLSERFGLAKLAPSTHLYTGDAPAPDFPGKTFEVTEVLPWNNATIKAIRQRFDRLDLTALNFPLDTDALRHRLSLPAGGPTHAFATTLSDRKKVLIVCHP
ncbi:MAG: SAM-dependent methyltransferase [Bacteroidales bacterium]|nr:SAM-dependent methyltransferase [Bacteroidales bacterium]